MHYVNTAFNFGGNCLVEKGSCTDLFQLFLERQEIKEIGSSFEVTYCFKFKFYCFLLVLFACKDPSPLYKSSKTRDYLNLRI